jgi:negative regulator of genetic competence, sporulation and motility
LQNQLTGTPAFFFCIGALFVQLFSSSAKIANIVANGKSFEMIKEKNSKPLTPVKKNIKEKSERLNKAKDGVEKKPTQREKLNKQRTNAKEKGRSSR